MSTFCGIHLFMTAYCVLNAPQKIPKILWSSQRYWAKISPGSLGIGVPVSAVLDPDRFPIFHV